MTSVFLLCYIFVMSATPPVSNKQEHTSCRPLSAVELLIPETEDDDEDGKVSNKTTSICLNSDTGIENGAFELGSPLLPSPPCVEVTETRSVEPSQERLQCLQENSKIQTCSDTHIINEKELKCLNKKELDPGENKNPLSEPEVDLSYNKAPSLDEINTSIRGTYTEKSWKKLSQCKSVDSECTLSLDGNWYRDAELARTEDEPTNAIVHEQDSCGCNDCNNTARNNKTCSKRSKATQHHARCSWASESDSLKTKETMANRRKTDPFCGNPKRFTAYHKNYQEALSSLLWEPYDCRSPNPSTSIGVSSTSWFYQKKRDSDAYHISSSSSTSSESLISAQNGVWRRPEKDPSISSLRPLISLESKEEEIEQATSLCKTDNIRVDPDREGRRYHEEMMVSDLYKRWVGGSGSVNSAPPGALACGECQEEQQWCCSCCQYECDRGDNRVSCGVCGGPMLVNVETSAGEGEALVTTSSATQVGDVSVVSCYRSVPSIPCLSSSNSNITNNNSHVSNVHIIPSGGGEPVRPPPPPPPVQRTFTSTEAQTDEIGVVDTSPVRCNNREQRRRERRERRHQRRLQNSGNSVPPHDGHHAAWQTQVMEMSSPPPPAAGERLPDILNSHLPPPYSTLPLGMPPAPPPHIAPPPPPPVPASPPPHHTGMRFPFQITPAGRRRSRRSPRGQHYTPEEEPKSCCGVVVTQTVSIRWFIVMIAFVGICCAVVGTVLGAMKTSGREHLTVSLLMIGVGIVLITVSGVAWRLTAHDAPSCRMMLGLGGGEEGSSEPNRRFVPRLPPSYGRPHHPYAAMMYPEFQYRPPPPSYQASMQEYRLRLLLLDRHPGGNVPAAGHISGLQPVSPPPTYRSHSGSTLRAPISSRRDVPQSEYSRPPSYRSRTSSTRPTMDPGGLSTADHSRDPSLSLSESGGGSAVVNVINVRGSSEVLDTVKMAPDPEQEIPLRLMLEKGSSSSSKDGNLVTIVQTGNNSSPVIVTVSGSAVATTTMGGNSSQPHQQTADPEMEILAHL